MNSERTWWISGTYPWVFVTYISVAVNQIMVAKKKTKKKQQKTYTYYKNDPQKQQ